ncbi:MAG: hypothetical protein SFY69_03950 [Planctomycetota bacterium]|nr:hypothetical protein [Planctomycetota bacterium]
MLTLVGGAVMLFGIVRGVLPLIRTYQQALERPLDESASGPDLKSDMLTGVVVGACGVPVFLVGTVMMKAAFVRRLRRLGGRS